MTKGPWDSYKKLTEIRQHMNDLVEASLRQLDGYPNMQAGGASWTPPFDMIETEEQLLLYGELPGVQKQQIEIQLVGLELVIKGERAVDVQTQGGAFYLSERFHGSFQRSFKLPVPIDESGIQTSLTNGVLEIRLPKRKPRQIPIH